MPARPEVSQPAPNIDLPQHGSENRWSLAEQRGRTIVVIFHRHIH